MLQWGRNLFVAECLHNVVGVFSPDEASMGAATCSLRNGLFTAVCIACRLASMGPQLVRCGMQYQGQEDAQYRTAFNGAATCSLRNDDTWECICPAFRYASMGPQLVRCGMLVRLCLVPLPAGASMGPQLVRCGMKAIPSLAYLSSSALQWGRNLFVAECECGCCGSNRVVVLQWGRNLFVAECQNEASLINRSPVLQWGRNLFVAEWSQPGDVLPVLVPASMGPQLVRCGMT